MLTTDKWKMGGAQNSLPRPSLTCVDIKWMNSMTKKATLDGPSSDETFPLMEKTKFYALLLAAASYPA